MAKSAATLTEEQKLWIDRANAEGDYVVNIGQISKDVASALNREVRAGRLVRCRGYWCDLGIDPLKTIWCRPDARFPVSQGVQFVEAHGDALRTIEELHAARDQQPAA